MKLFYIIFGIPSAFIIFLMCAKKCESQQIISLSESNSVKFYPILYRMETDGEKLYYNFDDYGNVIDAETGDTIVKENCKFLNAVQASYNQ